MKVDILKKALEEINELSLKKDGDDSFKIDKAGAIARQALRSAKESSLDKINNFSDF